MQRDVDAIHSVDVGAHELEQLRFHRVPGICRQNAARGDELGAVAADDIDSRLSEDFERSSDFRPPSAVGLEKRVPATNDEITQSGIHRIEAGDFLTAFGNQDLHGIPPQSLGNRSNAGSKAV